MKKFRERMSLDGKVIVLTGAAGILGSKAVIRFLEQGARVCALDLSDEVLACLPTVPEILKIPVNVADRNSIESANNRLRDVFGEIDVLINNAATKSEHFFAPFEDYPLDDWNQVMSVNLTGAMICSQIFGKSMVERKQGVIVNTLSIYGIIAPDQRIYEGSSYLGHSINTPAVYSASKAGLWGLTKYLAAYWGHLGIRVNAVTPGGVYSGQNETFVKRYVDRVPLARMADAEDIINAFNFLASDAAAYINGQNIIVDGGLTAW